jgi:D-3-phosphoglycerate dehydrogenase
VTPPRPVVVASGPWEDAGWERPLLEAGYVVRTGPSADLQPGYAWPDGALGSLLADADAWLISGREHATRELMAACPRLRLVVKATIGVERVDIPAATDLGILVANSPAPENFSGVSEAAVMLALALTKRLAAKERVIRSGSWRDHTGLGTLLAGQAIGIVGLGRIGGGVARRLAGWDVRVLAADPYIDPGRAVDLGAELVPLDALLAESGVVTVHVPLTAETRHLIDAPQLARMRREAYLVNTSRGAVVNEAALAEAIASGDLAGAAIDVFADEPLPADSPLRRLDPERVILTPHSVGANLAMRTTGTRMALQAIRLAMAGMVPAHVLNPEAVERWSARFGG